MSLTLVVDGFYGDCGKGVVSSYLVLKDSMAAAVRSQGPQAGHTVVYNGKKDVFRQIPAAVYNQNTELLIAVGAFVRPDIVLQEIETYREYDVENRLRIDENATAILPEHIEKEKELVKSIGSLGTGVGPAYVDRVMRRPDILVKFIPELKKYSEGVCVSKIVNDYLDEGKYVIIEGAHGTGLSNFHGTYPFTNAYDNTVSALLSQTGIGPKRADRIVLVLKSFVSRVGEGPLNGQLPEGEVERRGWAEYGTVSGRPRRAGPFDTELARKSIMLNTPTDIALTKIDKIYPETVGVTDYTDLPKECQHWIEDLEDRLNGPPITLIKTGPDIFEIIDLRKEKGTI